MDILREKIALLVEGYQWDSGEAETEARDIADAILAIPELKEALEPLRCNDCGSEVSAAVCAVCALPA